MKPDRPNEIRAVALKYDQIEAPKVTAKGEADIAQAIIDVAREYGVPLYENRELVELLATLEIGAQIPELLYRIIAEVIAFAYFIQGKTPQGFAGPGPTPETDRPGCSDDDATPLA
jgi:flagellar biosynthesis protein